MKYDNRDKTVTTFLQNYVDELKNKLPNNTGKLVNSLSYSVDGLSLGVNMMSYAMFLENGVNGIKRNVGSKYSFTNKKPPISSVEDYANSIGANPYALQNYIYQNGIRPKKVIEPLLDSKIDNFVIDYINAFWSDFKQEQEDNGNNNSNK